MKKGNRNDAGRGYCGYFQLKGNRVYLRSSKEFIVASWLESTNFITKIDVEPIYDRYKPDFVIYSNGVPRTVIEVKDNRVKAENYLARYSDYFRNLGLRYLVIYSKSHFDKLSKKAKLTTKDLENWKENSDYDYSGPNNPKFGIKATEETKRKIGDKTLERYKDPVYQIKHRTSIKQAHINNPSYGRSISRSAKARFALINPLVETSCSKCNKEISITKIRCDNRIKKEGVILCSSCIYFLHKVITIRVKQTAEDYRNRFKLRLLATGKALRFNNLTLNQVGINKAKEIGIVSKNTPISEKVIVDYFGSMDNYIKECNGTFS